MCDVGEALRAPQASLRRTEAVAGGSEQSSWKEGEGQEQSEVRVIPLERGLERTPWSGSPAH